MKYYCKNCNTEILLDSDVSIHFAGTLTNPDKYFDGLCPICDDEMEIVPVHETPENYEKRTGKPYPDMAFVWTRHNFTNGCPSGYKWKLELYSLAKYILGGNIFCDVQIVVAFLTETEVPPPDDWRPE